ncbi:hypothetical protein TNCV_3281321 [Trichonephila clavipes]|nr:hypothetical protein TNCV_3281321 [Trichonephila clavipes]
MASHTIRPAVGAVCLCKAKAGLMLSTRGLYTRLSLMLRLNQEFVAKDDLVPFCCSPVSKWVAPLQTKASIGERQGQHT